MRSNLYKFLIAISCTNFSIGCSGSNPSSKIKGDAGDKLMIMDSNYKKSGYDTTILVIERKAVNNVSWDELFGIKEFKDLYEHSPFYIDDAIELLGRDNFTLTSKKISINSMQRLSIEDYTRFCNECKSLYDKGKITEDILEWAINPNFSNRHLIVRNYEDASVIKLLESIKNDPKISTTFKKSIDNILSGKAWLGIKQINADMN
jgi:hypothetical protein